jgi:hypothetical protein
MKQGIEVMAREGFTDVQMCRVLHISESTLTGWKKKDPEFFTSLKRWKNVADTVIEKSLFQRAKGFIGADEKYYPPETLACIFWLCNRKGKEWKRKQEVGIDDKRPFGVVNVVRLPPEKPVPPPPKEEKIH